ncbi:hypothetical protein GF327_07340 [Candidatus Woesearchaeota archaeon]|nr:hypothetical protein [Candidatus Woesearchaeota archaeon]
MNSENERNQMYESFSLDQIPWHTENPPESLKVHFPPVFDWWLNVVENEDCHSFRHSLTSEASSEVTENDLRP